MKKKEVPPVPAPLPSDGGITVHNRLHAGHSYQSAIDEVVRAALRGLPGPWDVSVYAVGRAWFRIDVVAPDGASWSASVPVYQGPRPEDLGDTLRAAFVRHSCLTTTDRERRSAGPAEGSSGNRDGGPKTASQRGGSASASSPAGPEETSR